MPSPTHKTTSPNGILLSIGTPMRLEPIFFGNGRTHGKKTSIAWINPPFNRRLIAMTVDKIISWNITGILCVPAWTRSGWWWLVRRFARKILRVSKSEKLFLPNLRLHRHGPNLPNTTRWDTFICLFTWDSPLPLDSWTSPTSFKPFRANSDYG